MVSMRLIEQAWVLQARHGLGMSSQLLDSLLGVGCTEIEAALESFLKEVKRANTQFGWPC